MANFPVPDKRLDPRSRMAIQKLGVKLGPESEPVYAGVTITSLTGARLAATDAAKKLASVGNLAAWVAGTTNRVTVADDGDGTITLSTPQDTHTGAAPEFAGLAQVGSATDKVVVGATGVVALHGAARVGKRLQRTAPDFSPGVSAATGGLVGNYYGLAFGIDDDAVTNFKVPPDWDPATPLTVYVYWAINEAYAADNGEVKWELAWSACPVNETEPIDSPTHGDTISYDDQDIPATAYFLTASAGGVIPAASLSAGDLVGLTLKRVALDAGNDPTAEPIVLHVDIHYVANTLGETV